MKIVCLQHVHFEGPGIIEQWAIDNNHSFKTIHLYKKMPLPEPDNVDFLVVMGGPMSFDDDRTIDYLSDEKQLIKKIISFGSSTSQSTN